MACCAVNPFRQYDFAVRFEGPPTVGKTKHKKTMTVRIWRQSEETDCVSLNVSDDDRVHQFEFQCRKIVIEFAYATNGGPNESFFKRSFTAKKAEPLSGMSEVLILSNNFWSIL